MELGELVGALRARWWLPVIGAVLAGAIAVGATLLTTPVYTSSMQFFVSTTDSASTSDAFQGSQFSEQRVTSYARLLTGKALAARVADDLGLKTSGEKLADQVTATAEAQTVLLDVTVTDPSPQLAQRIAETLAKEFSLLVSDLEATGTSGGSPIRVTLTEPPDVPSVPSSPQLTTNLALGLLVGLIIGAVAAVARTRLDATVKEPEQASALAGVPVIGTIIRDDDIHTKHIIDRILPTQVAEDYRKLRTSLQFLNVDDPPRVIMVTSAMPAEGKTTAVLNLALALAEAGQQVTILDADLRRPRVARYLGMVGGVGLTNILASTADIADVLQEFGDTGVSVIGAGPTPPNPSEMLASRNMKSLIAELKSKCDYLLIDAPPLLPVADSTGLAVMVDGVVLSVRYGQSRREQLQEAAETLQRVGARSLGVIMNIVPAKAGLTAAYGYADRNADEGRHHRDRA